MPTTEKQQAMVHIAELWRIAYRTLYWEVGEKPLVILVAPGISHINERQAALVSRFGCKVIWLVRTMQGVRNLADQNVLAADYFSITRFWRMRKNHDNAVAVMVHAAVSHTSPYQFKRACPGLRCISTIYDFISLFVPEEDLHLWGEYHGDEGKRARIEYDFLKSILDGQLSDAIIYKDGGPDWDFMQGRTVPTYWIPQATPSRLYQPLPPPDVMNSFCFIGTIVPKVSHGRPSGLFDDIMMEQIFREVTDQGMPIHAFVMDPHPDVLKEYQTLFPEGTVRVFPGAVLDDLLPRLKQRYRWGWALYHYPQPKILPMVKITLPTKIFSYIALGIPPVVSEEMEAVVKLIKKYDCGVVVSQAEIPHVREILSKQDYGKLQLGILRAREDLKMERFFDTLCRAIGETFNRKPIYLEPFSVEEEQKAVQSAADPCFVRPTTAISDRDSYVQQNRSFSGSEHQPCESKR